MGIEFGRMVNIIDHIREPILLEGEAYSGLHLQEYCKEQLDDPDLLSWRRELFAFILLFLDREEAGIIQQSSGTTGDPKSYTLSRDAMLNSARSTLDYFGLKGGEKALICLPVHYIAGKMMVVRALVGGLDMLLREPSSRPLQGIEDHVDFAAMVPLQLEESLQHRDPLDRISRLLLGGGELHPGTRQKLGSLSTPEIYESFGMTETYTHFALRRINGTRPDPVFKVLKNVQIATDSRGCLLVKMPGVTSGMVQSNDLVEINLEGDGFTWLGRYDNLINSGGIKIIPELLEEQIGDCLGHECLVLPEPDRKLGQKLVLVVEFEGGNPPLDTWMKQLKIRLSNYEVPKRVLTLESLPRNASMKPDRTSTRKLLL